MTEIAIVERAPTVSEYLDLVASVGWAPFVTPETAETALANTLFAVVAEREGAPVGMGRIIGDGALFFYVQDVLVTPELQGTGLGDAIVRSLMSWLDRAAPERAFVGLFSAEGKVPFYERYGFEVAPAERPGMRQRLGWTDGPPEES